MLMPLHVLRRAVALPYRLDGETLHVALADPQNVHAIDELRLATRYQLSLGVASRDDIVVELDRLDRVTDAVLETFDDSEADDGAIADLEEEDGVSDGPVVRMVNSIILAAAEDGASDVHFEAQDDCLLVRFRIDGVLQDVQRIPRSFASGVTTRLKVLAKMDIAERRKPQDGRISLRAASAGPAAGHPPRHPADGRGRDRGHASAGQVQAGADARGAGAVGGDAGDLRVADRQADGRDPRHRADRLGEVDDPVRGAHADQPPGDQRDHGRGSGRVPARRASTRCRSTSAPA